MKNFVPISGLLLILEWFGGRLTFPWQSSKVQAFSRACLWLIGFGCFFLTADWCWAAGTIPGEERAGVYYALTHLPFVVYLVLALTFLLSIVNLWFQARTAASGFPAHPLAARMLNAIAEFRLGPFAREAVINKTKQSHQKSNGKPRLIKHINDFTKSNEIVGIPRLSENSESVLHTPTPTPLDGINHPMPQFFEPAAGSPDFTNVPDDQSDKRPPVTEFRFSAAVDFPDHQELERREKEQISVSGSVKGPDGKGLSAVLVYLTDLEGTRVGQSCRSDSETGEFRVLANEPGKYLLKAYKRGLVLEDQASSPLPIESGKIEGYNLRMVPEGCVVQGKVVARTITDTVFGLEVRCVCKSSDLSTSVQTDSRGVFRIAGIPPNSECFLELYGPNGELLSRSPRFETVQKKEIYRELPIVDVGTDSEAVSAQVVNAPSPDSPILEVPKQA